MKIDIMKIYLESLCELLKFTTDQGKRQEYEWLLNLSEDATFCLLQNIKYNTWILWTSGAASYNKTKGNVPFRAHKYKIVPNWKVARFNFKVHETEQTNYKWETSLPILLLYTGLQTEDATFPSWSTLCFLNVYWFYIWKKWIDIFYNITIKVISIKYTISFLTLKVMIFKIQLI